MRRMRRMNAVYVRDKFISELVIFAANIAGQEAHNRICGREGRNFFISPEP